MLIKKAISRYLLELEKTASQKKFERQKDCLELFLDYLSDYADCQSVEDFNSGDIRNFLSNWYIKKAGFSATHAMDCLRSLKQFAKWFDKKEGGSLSSELKEDFQKLSKDIPCVFKVMDILGKYENAQRLLSEPMCQEFFRGGEEGIREILKVGDIKPFNPENINYDKCQEGYFRVTDIRDNDVEITSYEGGEPIFPVKFPKPVLSWLKTGFVINLSVAPNKNTGKWEILEHGFVYPE